MQQKNQQLTAEQQKIKMLEEEIVQLKQQHSSQLKQQQFDAELDLQIYKAKGRNAKAIRALLDLNQLQNSEDIQQEIQLALEQLKEQDGYLFEQQGVPMYVTGTAVESNGKSMHTALRAAFGLPL